jgi:hypothetical protein
MFNKMERKVGGEESGGGGLPCPLICKQKVQWNTCGKFLRFTPPPQLHQLVVRCVQLGDVNSLENGQTEVRSVGFWIRNPFPGGSV